MSNSIQSDIWHRRRLWWPVPVLIVLSLPVFFYNLGNYGLVNGDEGFYHRTAVNMVRSGDWLTIQWLGDLRVYDTFMNAPLLPWIRATLITIWGDSYWTMRLVSAAAGMLAVILTYRLGRQFMTSVEAFLAAILLLFSYQFVFLHGARTGELDAIITMLFVWLVYSLVRALRGNRSFIPHHLGLLALVSIKLPVIIVPVVFEAAFFALSPHYRKQIKRWILTLACMAPFAIGWHVYQLIDLGFENVYYVLSLMSEQASGKSWQVLIRGERTGFIGSAVDNAGFFGTTLLFGGFPHILLLPLAAIGVWRHRVSGRSADYLKLSMLAGVTVILFYCFIARRFAWYVIPCYPFIAILVARFLYRLDRLGRGVVAMALLGLAGAVAITLSFDPEIINPFEKRARLIAPTPQFSEIVGIAWRIYLPVLTVAIMGLIVMLRRVGRRWPVHGFPALCITLIVAMAGVRVAGALRSTTHVAPTEQFARELALRVERGEHVSFPLPVPELKGGETGRPIYNHHFGYEYELTFSGRRPPILVRPLTAEEKRPLQREELKVRLVPDRAVSEEEVAEPQEREPRRRAGPRGRRRGNGTGRPAAPDRR